MEYTDIRGILKDKADAKTLGDIVEIEGVKYEIIEVHIEEEWDENEVYWFNYGLKKAEITAEDLQKL